MDTATENRIRQEQMESFGRLTVGFCHDMRNHLSIIRESNGLLDDILTMNKTEADLTVKLKTSVAAVEQRVAKAAELIDLFGSMAHRSDTPLSCFCLNETITELYTFLTRYAGMRQVDLSIKFSDLSKNIYNDPALLQHILYRLFLLCLGLLNRGDNLIISTAPDQQGALITFTFTGVLLPTGLEIHLKESVGTALSAAVAKLKGTLKSSRHDDYAEIRLSVPSLSGHAV